jgi:lipopolysaccharide export system protein LptA
MSLTRSAALAVLLALAPGAAGAQMATLFPGLGGGGSDLPIDVEAASLEVAETETERIVTFTGGVVVTRGATSIRAATIVLYSDLDRPEPAADPAAPAAAPAEGAAPTPAVAGAVPAVPSQQFAAADAAPAQETIPPNQTFTRIEATGGVTVNSGDQSATGAAASFNMLTQMITLSGNVRLAQGGNIITGERLVVDLVNSTARVEQGGGERIRGTFIPGAAPPPTP